MVRIDELPDTNRPKLNNQPKDIPFLNDMGVEMISAADGVARVALNLQKRHTNSWNSAHGGVLMSMLDVSMSRAGRSLDPTANGGITIEMKTSFFLPAGGEGGRIEAVGRVVHRSATLVFCESEIRNSEGALIAKASGTFKYRKQTPREAQA